MSGPEFGLNLATRLNINYTKRNNLKLNQIYSYKYNSELSL